MNNRINILITSILSVFVLSCCNTEIDGPYLEGGNNLKPIDSGSVKKVLLEDYTGFTCGNCPKAAIEAHRLIEAYPDKIIVMAVHAGNYAEPNTTHTYDFRTETGTEWDSFFGNSAAGNPNGMVSRKGFLESEHILRFAGWEQVVQKTLSETPKVTLELVALFFEESREILAFVSYNYLQSQEKYNNLIISIIEDSVVEYQTDYTQVPKDIEDYVHNHVLRKTLNGPWGDKLLTQGGTKIYKYRIPENSDWRPEKLKIVAFISDVGNTYEVIQAEEADLIEDE
ncbi:Omp28-related outer membrane protein [Bacteroidota bacterium]